MNALTKYVDTHFFILTGRKPKHITFNQAFRLAVFFGHINVVRTLLPVVDLPEDNEFITIAAENGDTLILHTLLRDPRFHNKLQYAFHAVIKAKRWRTLRFLIKTYDASSINVADIQELDQETFELLCQHHYSFLMHSGIVSSKLAEYTDVRSQLCLRQAALDIALTYNPF